MSSLQIKYETAEEKLEEMCEKNSLCMEFKRHSFPIIFRFTHDQSENQQMKLVEGEASPLDPNASLEFIFGEDVTVQISKNFKIDDNLLNSLRGSARKLHYLFLQVWFQTHMQAKQL